MDNKEIYKLHADFCKFMGHSKRIELIFLLSDNELCVEDIAKKMGIKIPNLSQHLSIMKERNIVQIRRDGVKLFYSLSNPKILTACNIMRDLMIEQLNKKIKSLKEDKI